MAYLGFDPSQRVFSQNSYTAISGDTATTTGLLPLTPLSASDAIVIKNGKILYPNIDYTIDSSTKRVKLNTPCQIGDVFLLMNLGQFNFDSAQAVRNDLASISGASYIGIGNGRTQADKNAEIVSVKDFGAVGDGITDDSDAFISATSKNETVYVPAGIYNVKNVTLTNCTLVFAPAAEIVSTLGATDVCIRMSSNSKLLYPKISVNNSASPIHGGYGCAIAIGYYADVSVNETNIRVVSPTLICTNTTAVGLAISVVGNVSDISIDNPIVKGAYAIAFQAHWGGVFDENNPDTSTVTSSVAPNDIAMRGLKCESNNGYVGDIAISLSGVFDVRIDNTVSEWKRALLLTPGDVYAQVATPEQASKIMTGIIVDGLRVSDPASNSGTTGESPILITGASATVRTSVGRTYTADGYCGISVKNVSFSTASTYSGAPLAYLYYVSKTELHIKSITGFESSSSTLVKALGSDNCKLVVDSVSQPLSKAVVVEESSCCDIRVTSVGSNTTVQNTNTRAFGTGSLADVTINNAATLNVNDTTIQISPVSGGYTLMKGTRLYFGSEPSFVTVSESIFLSSSANTTVKIYKSPVALTSGSTITLHRNLIESSVFVSSLLNYTAAELYKTDCVKVQAICNQSGKYDVLVAGNDNANMVVKGVFNGCGSGNAGGIIANIFIANGNNILVAESEFEPIGTSFVQNNIYAATATELSSLKVTSNHFGGATQRAVYLPVQSSAASTRGKNQVWGNSVKNGLPLLLDSTVTGVTIGNQFTGVVSASAAPTSGFWSAGDRVYDSTPTVGQPKSWVCTVAGTPGTWVSEGNL